MDGTADRIVVGGPPGEAPPTRFEVEARFDDGMRAAADGAVTLRSDGVTGRVEGELRGLNLVKISRYAENAADVSLLGGYLDGAARIDLVHNDAEGEIEIFARRIRIRRNSDNPLTEIGSRRGEYGNSSTFSDHPGSAGGGFCQIQERNLCGVTGYGYDCRISLFGNCGSPPGILPANAFGGTVR